MDENQPSVSQFVYRGMLTMDMLVCRLQSLASSPLLLAGCLAKHTIPSFFNLPCMTYWHGVCTAQHSHLGY